MAATPCTTGTTPSISALMLPTCHKGQLQPLLTYLYPIQIHLLTLSCSRLTWLIRSCFWCTPGASCLTLQLGTEWGLCLLAAPFCCTLEASLVHEVYPLTPR